MSIIKFDTKEFSQIAKTIINNKEYIHCIFSNNEIEKLNNDAKQTGENEKAFINNNIIWFVNRLYMSNQIAYYRDYMLRFQEPVYFNQLSKTDLKVMPLVSLNLLKLLMAIDENISDGNGYIFLPIRDLQRLQDLIKHIALKIAISKEII